MVGPTSVKAGSIKISGNDFRRKSTEFEFLTITSIPNFLSTRIIATDLVA